ncbi:MAG: polyprenyl synthetase family protein [Planctomycetota bacterium]|nr:polyprenyl synthetase family protein [Planctomycetota bacterium]MDP6989564.1 polyprenyl synthetase family protein [Planctomycetota bacterium]
MPADDPPDLDAWLADSRAWIEGCLEGQLADAHAWPPTLAAAVRHALFGGGKRLRPALVRLMCREHGGSDEQAAAPAGAVEMVHTYSLVHDDLPCMDDDDLRRGRPTVHRRFDEATAVLTGDALLTRAFGVLAQAEAEGAPMVAALARAAGPAGLVGGQVLDLALPGSEAQAEAVRAVHEGKTAALLAASAELGALAAGADEGRCAAVRAFGSTLGLCFQAIDDVLDVTGDAATLGKMPGTDARHDRGTLVAALGLEGARAEAARLGELATDQGGELGFAPGGLPLELVSRVLERDR